MTKNSQKNSFSLPVAVHNAGRSRSLTHTGHRLHSQIQKAAHRNKVEALSSREKAKRRSEAYEREKYAAAQSTSSAIQTPSNPSSPDASHDPSGADAWEDLNDDVRMGDVARGEEVLEISHGGSEVGSYMARMGFAIANHLSAGRRYGRRRDGRARRDLVRKRWQAFGALVPSLVPIVMHWHATRGSKGYENLSVDPPPDAHQDGSVRVKVVDFFQCYDVDVPRYACDQYTSVSLIRAGLLPSAPFRPGIAVSFRTMEFYHRARQRCPRLSLQSFASSLCDYQGLPARKSFTQQMSVCYDLHVALLDAVDAVVAKALHRDGRDWRLRNACPPCLYKLEGEAKLHPELLSTFDGNNTASRVVNFRRDTGEDAEGSGYHSLEREDFRDGRGTYWVKPEDVDKFDEKNFQPDPQAPVAPSSPCEERWHNMVHDTASKMWGIYEETGIFVLLCRHGGVLLVDDMIRSGELAKYALALVDRLLQVLHEITHGIGFDCGCKLINTVKRWGIVKPGKEEFLQFVVGLFHGHAHNRLCQLGNLPTYRKGVGLNHFEGCEQHFSKSNALASVMRHSSRFHRHQMLRLYWQHMDSIETFQGISVIIYSNVKQAVEILSGRRALRINMASVGVDHTDRFGEWLEEEKAYLLTVGKEPEGESVRLEYLTSLKKLDDAESRLLVARSKGTFIPFEQQNLPETRLIERERRDAQQRRDNALEAASYLENRLGIHERWKKDGPQWREHSDLADTREYRLALDKMEGLVVSRLLELNKMNMAGTGYKLRKHIAKALQTRSKTLRNHLERYNKAAASLGKPSLDWDEIVTYSFLGEFDILRGNGDEIRGKKWATRDARQLMDDFFKIQRAEEMMVRCITEARRFMTYMQDEELYLKAAYRAVHEENPDVAHYIRQRFMARRRLHEEQRKRIASVERLEGYHVAVSSVLALQGVPTALEPGVRLGARIGFNLNDLLEPVQGEDMDDSAADLSNVEAAMASTDPGAPPARSEAMAIEGAGYDSDMDGQFDWDEDYAPTGEDDEDDVDEAAYKVALLFDNLGGGSVTQGDDI